MYNKYRKSHTKILIHREMVKNVLNLFKSLLNKIKKASDLRFSRYSCSVLPAFMKFYFCANVEFFKILSFRKWKL